MWVACKKEQSKRLIDWFPVMSQTSKMNILRNMISVLVVRIAPYVRWTWDVEIAGKT